MINDGLDSAGEKTVLIVEDHALMRRTLCEYLQHSFPTCHFLSVAHGAGALEACSVYRPHLVLMDKCLPDADGIELTAQLKCLYPGIEVIVNSCMSGEIYVHRALAAGARAYLVKDTLSTDLIPVVAAVIGIAATSDLQTQQLNSADVMATRQYATRRQR